jgi:DNA-binding NarL/FixJ family response regulator
MLLSAVESLMQHKPFYTDALSGELKGIKNRNGSRHQLLSPREETILRLIAEGCTNKAISAKP